MKILFKIFALVCIFIPKIFAEDLVYKKILIEPGVDLIEIEKNVTDILVIEPSFLVVRIEKNKTIPMVEIINVQESDFIQRSIKINFNSKQELKIILATGIDIWQKENQVILGRAYDSQVKKLQEAGILVEKQ